jgi:hypothetical protein
MHHVQYTSRSSHWMYDRNTFRSATTCSLNTASTKLVLRRSSSAASPTVAA